MTGTTFETRLASGLQNLAESIDPVTPPFDLSGNDGNRRPSIEPSEPRGRLGLLAACAALLIGLVAAASVAGEWSTATEPGQQNVGENSSEAMVWMIIGVNPDDVASVAAVLEENPQVVNTDYVDQAQTFAEFVEHFANEPDLIDLVKPEDLPTSFRVELIGDQQPFIDQLTAMPGVAEVEFPETADAVDRDVGSGVFDEIIHNLRRLSPFHD